MSKTVVWNGGNVAFPVIAEWRFGNDALIQCVSNPGKPYESTLDMSGAEADAEIERALGEFGHHVERLITDERGVYGYVWDDGSVTEFWDCDECSYSEYMGEEI